MVSALLFAVAVAAILCLLFVISRFLGLRSELQQVVSQVDALERQKTELLAGLERQQFLSRFLRELPLLTEQLHSRVKARRIPGILLQVVLRSFEPGQALVLLRRRAAESEPGRTGRLTVAAVHPTSSSTKPGVEILIGQGELGFVGEAQLTMTREDFERETSLSRGRFRASNLPGFKPDLAAPMVFDEQTVGVIALSGSRYQGSDAKTAMWLVAQIGAVALHNVAAYSHMKSTADMDGLTRIYNKRHMIGTMGEQIYQAQKRLSPLSVFLFDIDNFKNYNDVNGHVAGDKLLQELAGLVKENIREDSIFGRFGGEEFLVILPGSSPDEAMAVAEKIRVLIANHNFPFSARQPLGVLSVSGGVATYPTDAMDSTSLLRAADTALYTAKHQGRNRVVSAQKKYIWESQEPTLAEPKQLTRAERARLDATIISQRIWVPDEEP
jgi:diguanylate cyclase (GGDEF)-like protein